ncbi:SDR family oxidoreductase [Luteibacter aegosomatis]|uniref:SDR family NAD(P)-dependent oxidoreductase n=1 Tax=Luteibacter aegosomatis TaxID=2911537 RepID=UPI001FF964F2|nr:SDR family oxidoreductase [Luteibacter aegosomatis]UPG84179.1 SDR family oxidoreductase [Luteibacter aegosomatis]
MATLNGKHAFVTGGSRGIGAAIVRRLAREGAKVTFTYVSSEEAAQAVVAEVANDGGTARAVRADSADVQALAAAIDDAAKREGGIDVLVNNAGIISLGSIDEAGVEAYDKIFAVNVRAVYAGTHAAVPHMKAGGSIVNLGSVVSDRSGSPNGALYSATKGAVESLTRGLARDLGPRGITVNNVSPGPTLTAMNPEEWHDHLKGLIAQQRIGEDWEIAGMVAFLAGPEARYVHGAKLTVDGGYLA